MKNISSADVNSKIVSVVGEILVHMIKDFLKMSILRIVEIFYYKVNNEKHINMFLILGNIMERTIKEDNKI